MTIKANIFFISLFLVFTISCNSGDLETSKKVEIALTGTFSEHLYLDQFAALAKNKEHIIIDVRTAEEFANGRIEGAKLMPINSSSFIQRIEKLDKDKIYLLYSGVGIRSTRAMEQMKLSGFKRLALLRRGINAWKEAGKKLEK